MNFNLYLHFRRVFRDLNLARNTFENDKELAWIADAFRLSEYALSHDPYQLAPHIIDRLSKEKVSSNFVLSEYALSYDQYQLAPHIIDRLSKEEVSNNIDTKKAGTTPRSILTLISK